MDRRTFLEKMLVSSLSGALSGCFLSSVERDWSLPYSSGNKQKVLLLGIDGVRPDTLSAAYTPHVDDLINRGCYSYHAQAGKHTMSGSCWSNLLCGVWENKHGVVDNTFIGSHYDQFPSLFTRLDQVRPDLSTASLVSWRPINYRIIPTADFHFSSHNDRDGDRRVARQAMHVLNREDPDVTFVYFGNVDMVGHKYGFHPSIGPYVREIEFVDRLIGLVLRSVRQRKTYSSENWLTLCTTDHGGSLSGHGDDVPEHRTVFYIASGPSAQRGKIAEIPQQVDIVPTILSHLRIPVDPSWRLDGKVCGLRRNS